MAELTRRELITFQLEKEPRLYRKPGIECGFFYNRHDRPLSPDLLQGTNWTGFYLEDAGRWLGNETSNLESFSSGTPYNLWLESAKKDIGRVFFGDIGISKGISLHSKFLTVAEGICGSMLMANSALAMKTGVKLTDKLSRVLEKDIEEKKISRRKFLVASGALLAHSTIGSWLNLPSISDMAEDLRLSREDRGLEISPVLNSVTDKITRLRNATHPEDMVLFTRNLITASKLNALGEFRTKHQQPSERLAVTFGRGHRGLEDLFVLGADYCSLLLSCYPKGYFQLLTDDFHHVEQLKTISLVTWDKEAQKWQLSERIVDSRLEKLITRHQIENEP